MGDIPFKNNLKAIDLLSVAGIAHVGRVLQVISGDSQITQDLGIHVKDPFSPDGHFPWTFSSLHQASGGGGFRTLCAIKR